MTTEHECYGHTQCGEDCINDCPHYRDGNLQEGYSETINSASFDDEDEPAKTSTPKRKRKKAEAPAAKRGTAKKSISTVKPTARRSQ